MGTAGRVQLQTHGRGVGVCAVTRGLISLPSFVPHLQSKVPPEYRVQDAAPAVAIAGACESGSLCRALFSAAIRHLS